jgi:hypothetical protein
MVCTANLPQSSKLHKVEFTKLLNHSHPTLIKLLNQIYYYNAYKPKIDFYKVSRFEIVSRSSKLPNSTNKKTIFITIKSTKSRSR